MTLLSTAEIETLVAAGLRAGLVGGRETLQARLDGLTLPTFADEAPQLRADLACLNQRELAGDPHPLVAYLEGAINIGEAADYARFAGLVRSRITDDSFATYDDLDELDADALETQKEFAALDELDAPGDV
ncbi:MAG: hypothetical protein ACI9U2_003075 [Bradymonadia bacterium]|jgi:hypothetical protein